MTASKPNQPRQAKPSVLHPLNPHQRYDFPLLCQAVPALEAYLCTTVAGDVSIDFANPAAVKALNQALLVHHYQLAHWDLPPGYLCPAVPGRLDYLLHLADVLAQSNQGKPPKRRQLTLLDIGCGANLIYPLLAVRAMGWRVIASDIDQHALQHAKQLIAQHQLQQRIELRQQPNPQNIFAGLLQPSDYVDVTLCNPPFHRSADEAAAGSARKRHNLGLAPTATALNFAGQANELWCEGGEAEFIKRMIEQSQAVGQQVFWFSCLVAKQQHLAALQQQLQRMAVTQMQVVSMAQGNKQSRFLCWTFLTPVQQQLWRQHRWS